MCCVCVLHSRKFSIYTDRKSFSVASDYVETDQSLCVCGLSVCAVQRIRCVCVCVLAQRVCVESSAVVLIVSVEMPWRMSTTVLAMSKEPHCLVVRL